MREEELEVHNHEEEPEDDDNDVQQPDDAGVVSEEDEDDEDPPEELNAENELHHDEQDADTQEEPDEDDYDHPDGEDQGADEPSTSGENQGAGQEATHQHDAREDQGAADPVTVETVDDDDEEYESGYNLRDRRTRNPGFADAMDAPHSSKSYYPPHQFVQTDTPVEGMNKEALENYVFGFVMAQMTAQAETTGSAQMSEKAGIKKFGRRAEEALMTEFAQLQDLTVFEGLDPSTLTSEQRRSALRAINLIKEKRDGRIKGRTVADGRPQRSLYDKSETASPTVSIDALMLSLMIDAKEKRNVATADVVGAYLKANMKDFVIMKFTGKAVRMMCEMNSDYEQFVTTDGNGQEVLYVRLLKALYGCVQSALLWYDLFTNSLKDMGFVLNPYDPCVANCTIDDNQCTLVWYVDDNKISHVDSHVVTSIIDKIEERFDKMSVTRGNKHKFLGMDIEFPGDGTVKIKMKDYLVESIAESGMNIERTASTPAKKNLFEVDDDAAPLTDGEAKVFHSVVAKLLYVSLRTRMDLLLPVIFLCTRVSKATAEDKLKLKRVLEYIHGTLDYTYTLGADDLRRFRTWIDAAYATHSDMKSHTGGLLSFGTGGLLCKSSKQKLNTKSSTEAELVGASDYLPNALWTKMFLEAQGYTVDECFLEQDNESAIKLEKNGRMSCGPKSRHINIRYFFIKDRTASEGIVIRHCPTDQMLADFFTKPLQGALFRKFRDVILGYKHVNTLTETVESAAQERVEERPADGDSATSEIKEDSVQPKRVSWADVVAGRTVKNTHASHAKSNKSPQRLTFTKQSS